MFNLNDLEAAFDAGKKHEDFEDWLETSSLAFTWETAPEGVREKILSEMWDINLDYDWWDFAYDDFKNFGKIFGLCLDVQAFDLDRGQSLAFSPEWLSFEDFQAIDWDKLKSEYPYVYEATEHCQTTFNPHWLKIAEDLDLHVEYVNYRDDSDVIWGFGTHGPRIDEETERVAGIMEDLLRVLKDYCFSALRREYEWRYSEEAIIDTIEANEYTFDAEGNIV